MSISTTALAPAEMVGLLAATVGRQDQRAVLAKGLAEAALRGFYATGGRTNDGGKRYVQRCLEAAEKASVDLADRTDRYRIGQAAEEFDAFAGWHQHWFSSMENQWCGQLAQYADAA